jgi:hypothetical protein
LVNEVIKVYRSQIIQVRKLLFAENLEVHEKPLDYKAKVEVENEFTGKN